jgi:thiamine-monophosphate kinase
LDRFFPKQGPGVLLGRGDDAAVLSAEQPLCVSTDLFVEDVHFRQKYFSPADIGHKSLAVNLSDLAAMGAKPTAFTLCLTIACPRPLRWWEELFQGMAECAEKYGVILAGGDLSQGPCLCLAATVWGPCQRPLIRGRAQARDLIFVCGSIGLARAGLMLLEAGRQDHAWPRLVQAHLRPTPLVDQGRILADINRRLSLMDISDGLVRDLPRLLGPGLGAELTLTPADLDPDLVNFCRTENIDPVVHALMGGEDYGLVGTIEPEGLEKLESRLDVQIIGRVKTGPGLVVNNSPANLRGFDHFAG